MNTITVAVIGAGSRGNAYARLAHDYPDKLAVVAVAEPDETRRTEFADAYSIPPEHRFEDWQDLLAQDTLADGILICTIDTMHLEPVRQALAKGYHVLLEKPMSASLDESVQIVRAAEASDRLVQVCHVLRYTAFFREVYDMVQGGRLGDVVHITHSENLVYWHMAHSYVRGNWRNTDIAAPMIVAKCCHDFDILHWVMNSRVTHLSSFGNLMHFKPENAPEGATLRCTDGCPVADTCKFYAPRLYANDSNSWPQNVVAPEPSAEARLQALIEGPYGRCVYYCDNSVVDHQTTSMLLENGATITLIMNGHGVEEARTIRIDGTRGTLFGKFSSNGSELMFHDHRTGMVEYLPVKPTSDSKHGGGDVGIMHSFVDSLRGKSDPYQTNASESLESHLLAFAAEESRLTGQTIDMAQFRQQHTG